jgi:hypothetical protein
LFIFSDFFIIALKLRNIAFICCRLLILYSLTCFASTHILFCRPIVLPEFSRRRYKPLFIQVIFDQGGDDGVVPFENTGLYNFSHLATVLVATQCSVCKACSVVSVFFWYISFLLTLPGKDTGFAARYRTTASGRCKKRAFLTVPG